MATYKTFSYPKYGVTFIPTAERKIAHATREDRVRNTVWVRPKIKMLRISVLLAMLACVTWTGASSGEEYGSEHYGEEDYDSGGDGGGSRSETAAAAPKDSGFVQPLDFSPLFQGNAFGLTPLTSQPMSAAILQADKSQYPVLFDTAVASSIDLLQPQVAASESIFSPENFGFKPVVSQGYLPALPAPARFVQPQKYQQNQHHHQHNVLEIDRTKATAQSAALTRSPLQYNIQTRHDPNYRVYKSEDDLEGKEILAALKKNPAVASYFTPQSSNIEITHPQHYRTDEGAENNAQKQNYRANAYLAGSSNPALRTRRYTDSRRQNRRHKHSSHEEDESPYDYKSEYRARPKEFDSGPYSSAYSDGRKQNDDDYGYDYGSDYNNDDYERIKQLSEAQAAEIKENPEHCKEVKKDSMTCMVCKNPKTGGNYESCSYVAEPKSNKYAYSREKKFDSKDQPDEPEDKVESPEAKPEKLQNDESSSEADDTSKQTESIPKYKSTYRAPQQPYSKYTAESKQPYHGYKRDPSEGSASAQYKYSPPSPPRSAAYTESEEDDDDSEEKTDSTRKPYNYKAAIPGFYTDNENKKDVEHVLAEFKKKDRSACKKVNKNGMTCYQCIDANGLKHEECMFISESAPKKSHLAYQELKEFTSKPATLDGKGNEGAESQIVSTATPLVQKSAAYVAASTEPYGAKLKRKKFAQGTATATVAPVKSLPLKASRAPPAESRVQPTSSARVARSSDERAAIDKDVIIKDDTNVAPPEEFSGDASKGAFWAETQPRYSKTLGVTLPEFMLSASEHELSFDETVAGG